MSKERNIRPALFLDRDGIINVDKGYVFRRQDFEFIDGVFEVCRKAKELGYWIFVVTNQAGIGRGYYTSSQFRELSKWMEAYFKAEDIVIDRIYYCPHHIEAKYKKYRCHCSCRKPNPGMIHQASKDFDVDIPNSVLVGDKPTDIQAGQRAGLRINILYDNDESELCFPQDIDDYIRVKRILEVKQYLTNWVL